MCYKNLFLGLLLTSISFSSLAVQVLDNMDRQSIHKRTSPFAEVDVDGAVAGPTLAPAKLTPKVIYNKHCSTCHTSGVAGSPIFGNKKSWAPRIAKGLATLHKHAINGFGAMPPMGTCSECSEDDIIKTVDWIIKQSK